MECDILTQADFEADVEVDGDKVDDHYASILPLRCISLSQSNPEKWKIFWSFLSHCDERRDSNRDLWNYHSEHSVEFVRDICEMKNWSEEDIHKMIGIMTVNGLDVNLGEDSGAGELIGFYPIFSNLNHSCLANSCPIKLPDMSVEVRAQVAIPEGEEICFRYVTETQPTRLRRGLLQRKWFFSCDCVRCSDRTEAGTYLDGLLCTVTNCNGVILPVSPLDNDTDYSCDKCGTILAKSEALSILQNAEIEAGKKVPRQETIAYLEKFVVKFQDILHPTNYIMLTVKMKLGFLAGNMPPNSLLSKMTEDEVLRKMQHCQDVINVLDKLDQRNMGEGKWRARLSKEIIKSKMLIKSLEKDQ